MWKKQSVELVMACVLLLCFYLLSQKAAGAPQGKEKISILVDAGHGGMDPGMIGVQGLEEKGINLEIAMRLGDMLKERGYEVIFTRETDQGLYDEDSSRKKAQDMDRRVELMRRTAPVLAVSIHQNSFSDPQVRGPQVFYYEDSREGLALAEVVQERLNALEETVKPRSVKGNRSYYLLKKSPCTMVIVECGFLTNPEEAELLQREEYQKRVAQAIADGIEKWLEPEV